MRPMMGEEIDVALDLIDRPVSTMYTMHVGSENPLCYELEQGCIMLGVAQVLRARPLFAALACRTQ